MKTLILIITIFISSFNLNAQSIDDKINELQNQIITTNRNEYDVDFLFERDEIKLNYSNKRNFIVYNWSEIAGLGITENNRVYIAFKDRTFEYVTPSSDIDAQKLLNNIDILIKKITGSYVRVLGKKIPDADN